MSTWRERRRDRVRKLSRAMSPMFTITTIEGRRQSSSHMPTKEVRNRYVKHEHDWTYAPRSVAGWGIAHCRTCPSWDIY